MLFTLLLYVINSSMTTKFGLAQLTNTSGEELQVPSLPLWILSWIFLFTGIGLLIILILYTKYGRETSIRLSIIAIVMASVFLGFAFHFFLLNAGI